MMGSGGLKELKELGVKTGPRMILRRWISVIGAVGGAGGPALVGVAPIVGNLKTAATAAEGAAAAKAKAAADGAPPKAKRKPNRELESLRSKATEKKKRRKPNKSKGETWYCENCGECVHVLLVKNPEHEHDGYCEYCSTHLYVEITII